ncbi:MAPEG family protein [Shimia gijangensis]|uniref:MAPEG family protein n=1 Tax=Shimia gijangensis TaxID=1470563 RepID=A0A1M6NL97_9RHOB|nr:MAPEG family protein [Shimia gijangensis]SHJ96519.1 MAPEG family protein [Shimia gijangensis]
MSSLEQYTALSALWIAIAWVPYILDRIKVRGLMDALANYDPNAIPQSAWAQRAMRAHNVAVQAFVAFGPLAAIAMIKMPDDPYPGTLAMGFFFGIVAHYIIYAIGIPVLRTLAFALASFSTIGLALRVLGVI